MANPSFGDSNPGLDGPIDLNVGGIVYATSKATLLRDPQSMLARMFGGELPTAKDQSGAVFVDRDGKMFRHVLNFLRDGDLLLPDSFDDFLRLQREADFFCLDALKEAAEAAAAAAETAAAEKSKRPSTNQDRNFSDGFIVHLFDKEIPGGVGGLNQIICGLLFSTDFRLRLNTFRHERGYTTSQFHRNSVRFNCSKIDVEEKLYAAGCSVISFGVKDTTEKYADKWFIPAESFEVVVGGPLLSAGFGQIR